MCYIAGTAVELVSTLYECRLYVEYNLFRLLSEKACRPTMCFIDLKLDGAIISFCCLKVVPALSCCGQNRLSRAVDAFFRDVMKKTAEHPHCLTAGTAPGLLEEFKRNNEALEAIAKGLEEFLEVCPSP